MPFTTIAQMSFLMNNYQRRGLNSKREGCKAYSYLTKRQRVLQMQTYLLQQRKTTRFSILGNEQDSLWTHTGMIIPINNTLHTKHSGDSQLHNMYHMSCISTYKVNPVLQFNSGMWILIIQHVQVFLQSKFYKRYDKLSIWFVPVHMTYLALKRVVQVSKARHP